jgi:Protein phosphatase 2C
LAWFFRRTHREEAKPHGEEPARSDASRADVAAGRASDAPPALEPRLHTGVRETAPSAPRYGKVRDDFKSNLPASSPLALPGITADAGSIGPFWVAAVSLVGLRHLHRGETGQDSYAFRTRSEREIVVAVADGLGESPDTAQLGALAAARLVCDGLASQKGSLSDPDVVRTCLAKTNEGLLAYRAKYFAGASDDEFSTTLAFCSVATVPGASTLEIVAGRIGDCGVFALTGGGWEEVFPRVSGAANVVHAALPSASAPEALELTQLSAAIDALVLTTDGLASDLYMGPDLRTWLADCWARPCGPFQMLECLRYRRQGSHDDRTAAVVWPTRAVAPAAEGADRILAGSSSEHEASQSPRVTSGANPEGDVPC